MDFAKGCMVSMGARPTVPNVRDMVGNTNQFTLADLDTPWLHQV